MTFLWLTVDGSFDSRSVYYDIFGTLANHLPYLENLTIESLCVVDDASLAALARNCPGLRSVSLDAGVNVFVLDEEPGDVVFPSLERLMLGYVFVPDEGGLSNPYHRIEVVIDMARILRERMPRLRVLGRRQRHEIEFVEAMYQDLCALLAERVRAFGTPPRPVETVRQRLMNEAFAMEPRRLP